jgi:hypothetical protein
MSNDANNHFPRTPQCFIDELYQQLKFLDQILTCVGVRYFIIGGTLLGHVRNREIIPYDDDADIGIDAKDIETVFCGINKIIPENYRLERSVHGLKLLSTKIKNCGTDLFTFRLRPDEPDIYELASERSRKFWPKEYFKVSEIEGINRENFGPITVNVTRDPERYLLNSYGKNCLTHGRLNGYDHINGKKRDIKIVDVKLEDIVLYDEKEDD